MTLEHSDQTQSS